jgi:ornithine cyclodeaminase/alanine dehydrogenase-like protein (mu-crystallin family)
MSLTVLSDVDVKSLLAKLGSSDVSLILSVFESVFHLYSTGQESQYQCHRQGVTRPGGPTMLFMPATLPGGSSVKVVGVPAPRESALSTQAEPIRGVTVICDESGRAIGVINAAETTAFRTSLGSIILYQHRESTDHIVVFGAGKQALWHLRLSLVLRGSEIRTVTIVNRSAQRAQGLIDRLREMDREGGSETAKKVVFSILDGSLESSQAYYELLRNVVLQADIIFCTTPSTTPLFPAEWLVSEQGRQKYRFISAIGSYKLDMQELDPALIRSVVAGTLPGSYHPKQNVPANKGVIIVDSREACALEAGELVKAHVEDENLLELGELVHLQKKVDKEARSRLDAWLKRGMVVYKSVGMGIMDLAICRVLLDLAGAANIGTKIEEF